MASLENIERYYTLKVDEYFALIAEELVAISGFLTEFWKTIFKKNPGAIACVVLERDQDLLLRCVPEDLAPGKLKAHVELLNYYYKTYKGNPADLRNFACAKVHDEYRHIIDFCLESNEKMVMEMMGLSGGFVRKWFTPITMMKGIRRLPDIRPLMSTYHEKTMHTLDEINRTRAQILRLYSGTVEEKIETQPNPIRWRGSDTDLIDLFSTLRNKHYIEAASDYELFKQIALHFTGKGNKQLKPANLKSTLKQREVFGNSPFDCIPGNAKAE